MKNSICDVKEHCFGCSACSCLCPKEAIRMEHDREGFLVPVIDEEKCVDCGMCRCVCPAINRWNHEEATGDCGVYAFENADESVIEKSTSGGFFLYLVERSQADVVCGCVQDKDLKIKHIIKSRNDDLSAFCGSKYVQSSMGNCFDEVKALLDAGKKVLFSGTSCQVHGLMNYLKLTNTPQENLVTADLVCHGVPSPKLYKDYLNNYEQQRNCSVKRHLFRNKTNGRGRKSAVLDYLQTVVTEDGYADQKSLDANLWQNVFFSDYCIRACCYACPYTSINKPANYTMGDFWGVLDLVKTKEYQNGCSLVIARNGSDELFDTKYFVKIDDVDAVKKKQARLNRPIQKPNDRVNFWKDYEENGFQYVASKYFNYNNRSRWLLRLYFLLIKLNLYRIANKVVRKVII